MTKQQEYQAQEYYLRERYGNGGCGPILALALLVFILLLTSCRSTKQLESSTLVERDSVRTETKTVTVYQTDTLYVEIPAQMAERTTADSTSHLENDYAVSDARINPDGTLFHSLATIPQEKPVEFQKPIEKRDSIIYKFKYRDKEVIKEKQLSKWEKFKMDYGGFAFGGTVVLLIFVGYRVFKKFST